MAKHLSSLLAAIVAGSASIIASPLGSPAVARTSAAAPASSSANIFPATQAFGR